MAKLLVRLVKSPIGRKPRHIATLQSLGLKKIDDVVEHNDTADIKGKLHQIGYMLNVEEVK
ncbi:MULTISPECIES: 50S ribosomal protein L30 [Psychrilyobacter]|jgi:large subunit ribosomal protein L30|uniref:Large ribosomal subunit protein uL30 n=1 Tax=Psychrilyobacter piezotolerans TaxID=2293438 RepID=A0ABX9KH00_9FUSO|nr:MULTISPECIES: 50S ribosomal protein L30 [Psychrilyobacter]MCS5422692.1 50S ribosomal protein L30 [Psychrilyobacter sp. S5]NDI77880.1 50S ribosomal protein L30 [Psychrilyobacter piezotolerans]RDE61998.1 50S ribosomal protein L30 [Psychrilyobacter sp. S5]REI41245.1 50S ribosomal protein L30 [Psychrilyobacter piezotolerans]